MQANIQSNTFVVSGNAETKAAAPEMSFEQQLASNPALLQQFLASQMQGGRGMGAPGGGDDDEMPELEQDFESAAK